MKATFARLHTRQKSGLVVALQRQIHWSAWNEADESERRADHEVLNASGTGGTTSSRDFLAAAEYSHGRYAGNLETTRGGGKLIDVRFRDQPLASHGLSNLHELGRYHFAWPAPGRPEIHQDW
jgi:hypothetical protein